VDPGRAHGFLAEDERRPGGEIERTLTIFLSGAECPFTCAFCDLWRYTIDGPTPTGALTTQVTTVLEEVAPAHPVPHRLKLYNASNWFDRRAVPAQDSAAIAALAAPFAAVTVESHANTVGAMTLEFAGQLAGRLEVAMGLETIHPVAAAQLNKRLDLPRFDRAAAFLAAHDIDVRVFVLLGAPHIPAAESVEWAVRSATYAVAQGAAVVSIIPVRGGNGELERLAAIGAFTPPTLVQLEEALEQCLSLAPAVVTADLWDAERLSACEDCRAARVARMARMQLTGVREPAVVCALCNAP
jgi:radical SAM enzyme (TIGR01210 family)